MEFTMNNKYFTTLLCITILALAPACCKRKKTATDARRDINALAANAKKNVTTLAANVKRDVNTLIELDNAVFEIEENLETKKSIAKF